MCKNRNVRQVPPLIVARSPSNCLKARRAWSKVKERLSQYYLHLPWQLWQRSRQWCITAFLKRRLKVTLLRHSKHRPSQSSSYRRSLRSQSLVVLRLEGVLKSSIPSLVISLIQTETNEQIVKRLLIQSLLKVSISSLFKPIYSFSSVIINKLTKMVSIPKQCFA